MTDLLATAFPACSSWQCELAYDAVIIIGFAAAGLIYGLLHRSRKR